MPNRKSCKTLAPVAETFEFKNHVEHAMDAISATD
jgi:hypothetical protein